MMDTKMKRTIITLIPMLLFIGGCTQIGLFHSKNEHVSAHDTSFPKLTERNRLIGALLPERTCYDVTYYDLNISIDPERKYLKGYVDIHARATIDFSTLQLDLAQSMQLNGVTFLGAELNINRMEDAVLVDFPEIKKGTDFVFRVNYEGTPLEAKRPPWDGGFVWEKDERGRPFISVACEGDGASLWWPCKDHIADEPDSMRMTYTVPTELFCVGNGRLENVSDSKDGGKTYTWVVKNPINNYNVSVQLGYYVLVQDTLQRGDRVEELNHYVLDYHAEAAREHFKQVRDILHFFEKYFGDYQWWEDGYKLVEVSYLGMEHQSAVTYGNNFQNRSDSRYWLNDFYGIVDGLLFHETAHEWWGNSVTAADPAHVWIHEGTAVYSEALFIEEKLGYNVSVDYLLKKRKTIQNKLPIVGPENENYWSFGDAYNKGAWALHTLRNVINDDSVWFDIMKSFPVENARKHVKTEDFRDLVNMKTGQNFTVFFDQYMYDPRTPTFEYRQKGDRFYYRWTDVQPGFNMPLDLDVNGKKVRVFPTEEIQSLTIAEFSVIVIRDWEFLIVKKKNDTLSG